jgi:hypothetical protein
MYEVSFDLVYSSVSDPQRVAKVFIGNPSGSASAVKNYNVPSTGTHTFTFVAQNTTTRILLRGIGYADVVVYDNVSVQEADAMAGWNISGTGATASANASNQLELTRNGASAIAGRLVTGLVYGDDYLVSFDLVGATGGADVRVDFDGVSSETTSTAGNVSFTITASNVQSLFEFNVMNTTSGTITVDNASVKRVVADRSVNGNGLNIVGNVTKSAVATGAELVGYSGFSSNNYLQQPYNSDLDFGTGDFCVMGWVKIADNDESIFDRGNGTSSANRLQLHIYNNTVRMVTAGTSIIAGGSVADGVWSHVSWKRQDGVGTCSLNGVTVATGTCIDNVSGAFPTNIGVSHALVGGLSGSLALLRISATAPTSEQIAKIYRDEKPLFQEGAKATLYGTLDANLDQIFGYADTVTALAYDEDTDLLHAGTSRGRSVFKGLQRIDNTTDAVGSAISAVNGLVAED